MFTLIKSAAARWQPVSAPDYVGDALYA